jgi:hypothetical protein
MHMFHPCIQLANIARIHDVQAARAIHARGELEGEVAKLRTEVGVLRRLVATHMQHDRQNK